MAAKEIPSIEQPHIDFAVRAEIARIKEVAGKMNLENAALFLAGVKTYLDKRLEQTEI